MKELYKRLRPKSLDGIIGQDGAVTSLRRLIEKGIIPHAILLTGPSGSGKTSIARILKKHLNCGDPDFYEINSADFKGIDTIREIRRSVSLSPIDGDTRVWLIDECFPGNVQISTAEGTKEIRDIHQGDQIWSLSGLNRVRTVFQNQVSLSRLVCIHFDNGTRLVTTCQHRILTKEGWIEAGKLSKGSCIFRGAGYLMRHATEMRSLWEVIPSKVEESSYMLLEELCFPPKESPSRIGPIHKAVLPRMWNTFHDEGVKTEDMLFEQLRQKAINATTPPPLQNTLQSFLLDEDFRRSSAISSNRGGQKTTHPNFTEDDNQQSKHPARSLEEDTSCEACQRNPSSMDRNPGRERDSYTAPKEITIAPWKRLDTEILNFDRTLPEGQKHNPSMLQGGPIITVQTDCGGGRWSFPSLEKAFIVGCQKDCNTQILRVESVENYQPDNPSESFTGSISNSEKDNGFVHFYDLEMEGHPSYFADGLPVHNCHKLTGDAQNALLKLLEDGPDHAYFMLATTDPHKVIKTVLTRCSEIKLSALSPLEVEKVIRRAMDHEKGELEDDVIEEIVEAADGSARKALVILEQVLPLSSKEEQTAAIQASSINKEEAIKLARLLISPRSSWKEIAAVLRGLDDDPEGVRYLVLAYSRTVLLGGGPLANRAFHIIDAFGRNFYDSKTAGLAAACWEVSSGAR